MESKELQQIIDFVEGRLPAEEFEPILYSNPRFEEVMGEKVYLFAIMSSYKTCGDIWDVQSGLAKFLNRQAIEVQPTGIYQDLFELILETQPKWLLIDESYVQKEMLPAAEGRTGNVLKKWLCAEFKKQFRYLNKPPKWIQNPRWPINENGPMMFMGQIPVRGFWHDEGAIYVFYDSKTGTYENISQVY